MRPILKAVPFADVDLRALLIPWRSKEIIWEMTHAERYALIALLDTVRPKIAIEVGTYGGGSLQALSRYAERVYSLDIDPKVPELLAGKFDNVEFRCGDSQRLLPDLLAELAARGEQPGFILIDGDHSTEGVLADIRSVLTITPLEPVFILFHDSFMPSSRQALMNADWGANKHLHFVEVDFVCGYMKRNDTSGIPMCAGLALAVMLPEPREGAVKVEQFHQYAFEQALAECRRVERAKTPWGRLLNRFC